MPVYKGASLIGKAIDCLQRQTFSDFEAIISVDANDEESAEACRPFLADRRFRMVVHRDRLHWVGNFNWLLQQELKEFFCYRQHDDTTAPEFFDVLLRAADRDSKTSAIYCDCQWVGEHTFLESTRSIKGETLDRIYEFIERLPVAQGPPIRGLIRTIAIRQAGLVRSDEFRAPVQIHGWLVKLLGWGNFTRVGLPLYYKLDRPGSFTREYISGSAERMQAEWTIMFTALLDAVMPLCRSRQERLFFQKIIFDRIFAYPHFDSRPGLILPDEFIAECLERLRYEGNTHLLPDDEVPLILRGLKDRVNEIKMTERSRLRRAVYRVRQRSRLGKLIYPNSRLPRIAYQIRYLVEIFRRQVMWIPHYMSRRKSRT